MTKDEIQEIAWSDFIRWAAQEPEVIARFEAETGLRFPKPPKGAFEAAIDKACKVEIPAEEFTKWATINLWGIDEAPAFYRASIGDGGTVF
jgi:hypothetical protein